jgi:hypothetical protein
LTCTTRWEHCGQHRWRLEKKFMAIDGAYPKRPVVSQRLIAPYLMVNPGKHPAELVRVDPSQNLPYPIRAGFFLSD